MAPFRTAFNGYAVKFSPFEEGRLAVATAQNFGIIGNGRQYVLQVILTTPFVSLLLTASMLLLLTLTAIVHWLYVEHLNSSQEADGEADVALCR